MASYKTSLRGAVGIFGQADQDRNVFSFCFSKTIVLPFLPCVGMRLTFGKAEDNPKDYLSGIIIDCVEFLVSSQQFVCSCRDIEQADDGYEDPFIEPDSTDALLLEMLKEKKKNYEECGFVIQHSPFDKPIV